MDTESTQFFEQLATEAEEHPQWLPFADSCRAFVRGFPAKRRKPPVQKWVHEIQTWHFSERRELLEWLIAKNDQAPDYLSVWSPFVGQTYWIASTLTQWIYNSPDDPLPYIWRAQFPESAEQIEPDLRRVVELKPNDTSKLELLKLITMHFWCPDWETREYDVQGNLEAAEKAEAVIATLDDASMREELMQKITNQRQLVDLWIQ